MATGNKKGGGGMVLAGRQMVGVFALLVVMLDVVFTLGYVLGRSEYDTSIRAAASSVPAKAAGATVKIDLVNQTLTIPSGREVKFPVDGFSKHCLVEGVDELGYILQREPQIAAYEKSHASAINTLK